jgi:hypothetical protein
MFLLNVCNRIYDCKHSVIHQITVCTAVKTMDVVKYFVCKISGEIVCPYHDNHVDGARLRL